MTRSLPPQKDFPHGWRLWVRIASRFLLVVGIFAAILFSAAGRIDWWAAWLVIVSFTVFLLLFIVWGLQHSLDLLRERSQMADNVKSWDIVINALYTVLLFAMLAIAGLDVRYGWSDLADAVQVVAYAGFISGIAIIWRALAENTFASRFARIQDDRSQVVVSSGPYRLVRHPMYAGIIVLMVCMPLVLGSWWALAVGIIISVLYVLRTALEDRMLLEELPGYAEYAQRTRSRLLPRIW